MRRYLIIIGFCMVSLCSAQETCYSVFGFDKTELQTFNVSVLNMDMNKQGQMVRAIKFLLDNDVRLVIIGSNDNSEEILNEFEGKNVFVMDEQLTVILDNFCNVDEKLVSSFPMYVGEKEHVAVRIARTISDIEDKIIRHNRQDIRLSYFEDENDIIIANPREIRDYNFSEIVIVTSLEFEKKFMTPNNVLCQSCSAAEKYSMYSSIVLSNMINTIIKLDADDWIIYR